MSLMRDIVNYEPTCEQEVKDKIQMLEFINSFDDVLTRENTFGHFSASAFIVNPAKDKMILLEHKILNSWVYPGGHADGESDLLKVALKEANEETGLKVKILSSEIFTLQSYPIPSHNKNGKYVSPHLHFDVVYLMEADDSVPLINCESESRGIKWVSLNEVKNNPKYEYSLKKLVDKLGNYLEQKK